MAQHNSKNKRVTRRDVLALLGSAFVVLADPARSRRALTRTRRLGILMGYTDSDQEARVRVDAFINGLQRRGWIDGKDTADFFPLGGQRSSIDSQPRICAGRRPAGPDPRQYHPGCAGLLRETHTIPIVFLSVSDPVGDGFVESLARPARNATGFTNLIVSLGGKWVELLKEMKPSIAQVAALFNPDVTAKKGGYYYGPERLARPGANAIRACH